MPKSGKPANASDFLKSFDGDIDAAVAALRQVAIVKPKAKSKKVNNNPVVVTVEAVAKHYKLGRQKVEAVKNVSLEIREGEFIAITGSSGSGKSTLLQLIGGLDKPTFGQITVDGHNISKLSDRKLSVFRNKTVGFVFQFFYLQPFLGVKTNLEVPAMFARTRRAVRGARAEELAEAVGLSDRIKHLPKELSGGQMQRAAIARALQNKPKLLLADEPTGNLDSANGEAIIELFEQVRRDFGTTVIVVTHDVAIAARADREIALKDGVLLA
jgi:putative ABC transport system ATP-binding protein